MADIKRIFPIIGIKKANFNLKSRVSGTRDKIVYSTNLGDVDTKDPHRTDYTVSLDQVLLGDSDGSMKLTNTIDCGEL